MWNPQPRSSPSSPRPSSPRPSSPLPSSPRPSSPLPIPSGETITNIASNLGQDLSGAINSITQGFNSLVSGTQQIAGTIGRYTNYRYPNSRDPRTVGPRGYIGGPVKYNDPDGYSVAVRDTSNLGLGTGGYGGQAGGYGGFGGNIALTSLYPARPNRRLIDQGTNRALPVGDIRSGMYGTRQAGPSIRRDPFPELDDESTLGTYDIGPLAYSDLANRSDSYGTHFTNRYGEGGYNTSRY